MSRINGVFLVVALCWIGMFLIKKAPEWYGDLEQSVHDRQTIEILRDGGLSEEAIKNMGYGVDE